MKRGSAPPIAPGTWLIWSRLRATAMAMTTIGTAIDRIVRGWRSRRSSDICSAGGTSTAASGLISASASCSSGSPIGWR